MPDPWFFVVRTFKGVEHASLEYGDHKGTQAELKEKPCRVTRVELPPGYEPTLAEAIAAAKAGTLPAAPPKPPALASKTFNSVRAARARRKVEQSNG